MALASRKQIIQMELLSSFAKIQELTFTSHDCTVKLIISFPSSYANFPIKQFGINILGMLIKFIF